MCISPALYKSPTPHHAQVEIFCEAVPKAAEVRRPHLVLPRTRAKLCPRQNFLALCASGYYDNCLWHRNIKGFMIQTGDPSGSGKGGQSIWGKPFPDEVRTTLKVPRHQALPPVHAARSGFPLMQIFPAVQQPRYPGHGELGPRHEQITVLHNIR